MQLIERLPAHSNFRWLQKHQQSGLAFLPVAFLILAANTPGAHAQSAPSPNAADPAEIVWRMVAQNETRARQLKYFTARRHYHVEFHGLGRTMAADMHVQVTYTAGSGKTFRVIDESGSRLLLDHVLTKLLETEKGDSRQQNTALTPFNYDFAFNTQTDEDGRLLYVFSVEPKVKNKLLYRGKIWIDAEDFAVVRVEAQPAENPSFWIKSTEIHHSYTKIGEFWLPQTNESESKVRFGGTAVLTIDYGTYQFEEPQNSAQTAAHELASRSPHLEP
jgi:hypothetical protein